MPDIDRLSVEKSKAEFARNLNEETDYIKFDNRKELFMYAVTRGSAFPKPLEEAKDALFNDRDLNVDDKALIYSLAFSETNDVDMLTKKGDVYKIIQEMANSGLEFIQEEISNLSMGDKSLILLRNLNKKYENLKNMLDELDV